MKLIELYAQNIKKLKLVRVAPKGPVTLIAGRNGQGKTTTLDVMEMLFGVAKSMPANPIRRGESSASASANLGDLLVEMTLDATHGRVITVRGKDGKKIPRGAQGILDRLRSAIAFDPQEFANADPAEQAEILRKLIGVDTSDLDAKRDKIYADREAEGRDLVKAKANLATMQAAPEGTPDEEIIITELVAEKDNADKANQSHAEIRKALAKAQSSYDEAAKLEKIASDEAASLTSDIDVGPIVSKIGTAESTNRAVRAKKERAAKAAEVACLESNRANMTKAIAEIEAKKKAMLDAIKWPIEGLGFSDGIVTYKGFALSESSTSERIKVGLAIGMASHPELQAACIRDGSSLDDESMAEIENWATENDFNVMIERVGTDDPGSVVIEDGVSRDWTPEDSKRRDGK
jgi:DNA repair exonuclease SbcCD ATPase subunit